MQERFHRKGDNHSADAHGHIATKFLTNGKSMHSRLAFDHLLRDSPLSVIKSIAETTFLIASLKVWKQLAEVRPPNR